MFSERRQGGVTQARIERHNVLQRARVAYPSPLRSVVKPTSHSAGPDYCFAVCHCTSPIFARIKGFVMAVVPGQ